MVNLSSQQIHSAVKEHYQEIAQSVPEQSSCCEPQANSCLDSACLIYPEQDLSSLPSEVTDLSLGCGDPVTLAALEPGQAVLDLGSGGGIDCFLAAKRVGPQGRVIGVDMTEVMIDRAEQNRQRLGLENVEFRQGQIEDLPVEDRSIDVILSNCVINLSPDKSAVFSEAFRVLKPGGKLAVSDIATEGPLPDEVKSNLSSWAGCLAGAWDIGEYAAALEQAGFIDLQIEKQPWGEEVLEAAFENLEPELRQQILENKKNNHQSMVINDGAGKKVIKIEGNPEKPKIEIFSAKITAYKPE